MTALCNLGYCYEQGRGVTQDEDLAVEYYRKAAEMGYAPAQSSLAACFLDGRGTKSNVKDGFQW
jgi:uncharacterized protein